MNISLLKLTWPLAFVGDGATWKPTVWMGWSHVGPSFREWAKKRVWRTTKAGRGRVQETTGLRVDWKHDSANNPSMIIYFYLHIIKITVTVTAK